MRPRGHLPVVASLAAPFCRTSRAGASPIQEPVGGLRISGVGHTAPCLRPTWIILREALWFVGFMSLYAIWITHLAGWAAETPVEHEDDDA